MEQPAQDALPIIVVPELEAAFDAADRGLQKLDESDLVTELHQALAKLGRDFTPPEKRGNFAVLGALRFMTRRDYGPPVWDMYWQPLSSWEDKQGATHYDPNVDQVDDATIGEWSRRARSAKHPIVRARFADVAWEIAKFRVAAARKSRQPQASAPVPPDPSNAALAIDAYLDAVDTGLALDAFDAARDLGRAIELAASAKASERLQRAKAAFFAYRSARESEDDKYPFWVFDQIAWTHRVVLKLSGDEKSTLVAALERVLAVRADSTNPTLFDPHSAADAADRLGRWRQHLGQGTEARRAVEVAGRAMEEAAATASGITAIALLERQANRYRQSGDTDSAARVEREIRRRGPEAKGELRRIETRVEVPKEELEKWVEAVAGTTFEEGLARLAMANLAGKGQSEARVREMAEHAPLFSHIPISVMRADGFSGAVISSVEDDPEGRAVHDAANYFGNWAPFLSFALTRFREKHAVDLAQLMAWLAQAPLFPAARLPFLRDGLSAWFAEDWIKAVHVLLPQIEAALRDLLASLGGSVMRPDPDHGGFQAIALGAVLSHEIFKEKVPEDVRFHLRALLTDQRGLNLRNDALHGLAAHELFDRGIANWLVHAVIMLALVRLTPATPTRSNTP